MQAAGLNFERPTIGKAFWLVLKTLIFTGTIYGIRVSIDDGTITNLPEVLRHLVFWPFSIALAIRFAQVFGSSRNSWPQRILIAFLFYIPIGLALAYVAGLLPASA